jgi:signal peptidase I
MNEIDPDSYKKLSQDLTGKHRIKKSVFREYVEALIWAVLLAFIIRSFIVEPYKIPSKSMVPTLLVGDHIFVNKFIYGLRIPGTKKWLTKFKDPQRGEVIVFIYPEDESLDFIKRVVGMPGDQIRITNGVLYINGHEITSKDVMIGGINHSDKRFLNIAETDQANVPDQFKSLPYYRGFNNYQIKIEDLEGISHLIQRSLLMPNKDEIDITVPPDHYFVMGDNRDQSADSRVWGFVPRENLKGQALFIWLSLDDDRGGIRIKRFGKKII